jgi:long-subunit acyl-CoA synthetase (AMP-forming)
MELTNGATRVHKALYTWSIRVGGGSGLMAKLANLLVLPAVRGELGFGRLRVAYIGDRPITDEIDKWARALGVTVRYVNPFQR